MSIETPQLIAKNICVQQLKIHFQAMIGQPIWKNALITVNNENNYDNNDNSNYDSDKGGIDMIMYWLLS